MEPIPTRYFPSGVWEPRWARIDPERKLGMAPPASTLQRPRVVIVGAGFGGLSAAKALARVPVDVTVIDKYRVGIGSMPLLYGQAAERRWSSHSSAGPSSDDHTAQECPPGWIRNGASTPASA